MALNSRCGITEYCVCPVKMLAFLEGGPSKAEIRFFRSILDACSNATHVGVAPGMAHAEVVSPPVITSVHSESPARFKAPLSWLFIWCCAIPSSETGLEDKICRVLHALGFLESRSHWEKRGKDLLHLRMGAVKWDASLYTEVDSISWTPQRANVPTTSWALGARIVKQALLRRFLAQPDRPHEARPQLPGAPLAPT